MEHHPDESPTGDSVGQPRSIRTRVGLGAGVVLVLVAAGIAVLVSALAQHPVAASTSSYSSNSSHTTASSSDDAPVATDSTSTLNEAGTGTAPSTAFVQVVGQVAKPGLYELPAGDRLVDAIAAAGGFTAKADQASLNLAQVIADGQQVVVGVKGAAPVTAGASSGPAGSTKVDINTADATALEALDGIGPALAQRILSFRTAHNGFRSISDLQNVTGIGPKKFAAIKGSVSV